MTDADRLRMIREWAKLPDIKNSAYDVTQVALFLLRMLDEEEAENERLRVRCDVLKA